MARSCSRSSSTIATAARLPEGCHRSSGGGGASAISAISIRSRPRVCWSENEMEATNTNAITSSEIGVAMWYQRLMIILMPTNARMIAKPC